MSGRRPDAPRAAAIVLWSAIALSSVSILGAALQQPGAAAPTREQIEFFESRIRPIFVDNC